MKACWSYKVALLKLAKSSKSTTKMAPETPHNLANRASESRHAQQLSTFVLVQGASESEEQMSSRKQQPHYYYQQLADWPNSQPTTNWSTNFTFLKRAEKAVYCAASRVFAPTVWPSSLEARTDSTIFHLHLHPSKLLWAGTIIIELVYNIGKSSMKIKANQQLFSLTRSNCPQSVSAWYSMCVCVCLCICMCA